MPFTLDPILSRDTLSVGDLSLSRLLLMNNRLYPWVVLVPRHQNLREIIDLPPAARQTLMEEISGVSQAMQDIYQPHKLNIAALGNQVSQLHIHVIARFREDTAWPNPVWGRGGELYAPDEAARACAHLASRLKLSSP